MALSNIFREPRRELTESAVGIITVLGFGLLGSGLLYGYYRLAESLYPDDPVFVMIIGLLGMIAVGLVVFFFVVFTHSLGENLCDKLASKGIELRPKLRPMGDISAPQGLRGNPVAAPKLRPDGRRELEVLKCL